MHAHTQARMPQGRTVYVYICAYSACVCTRPCVCVCHCRLDGGIDWGRLMSASAVEPPGASESAASDDTPVSTGKGRKGGKLVLAS